MFAVGDPDQAIYRWRGADSSKMSHSFLADFPGECLLNFRTVNAACFAPSLSLPRRHAAFVSTSIYGTSVPQDS